MDNPWLHIPASDYEGHMSSPNIAQQQFLARTFQQALAQHNSTSIALLGCTTGNGLEFINPAMTHRVTALDLNPDYLAILRQRFGHTLPGLEIVQANLETCSLEQSAYTLIHAGLVFEYVDPQTVLTKIAQWLRADGVLVTVLQLPASAIAKVSPSRYKSLETLAPFMKLIEPAQFKSIANQVGLHEIESRTITLESGKPFYIGTYSRKS